MIERDRTGFAKIGYGWLLEIAEYLRHEYGMAFETAAEMPLARMCALLACARVRGGGKARGFASATGGSR